MGAYTNAPATNADAIITLSKANWVFRVRQIQVSYSAEPSGAKLLKVEDGATIIWQEYITSAGPAPFTFPEIPLENTVGQNLKITLPAGGVGISGTVNAQTEE